VNAARSDPPTPWAWAAARAAQQREQERAARAKEKKLRRRERLEQYNEEYRLRELQGLSLPLAPAKSSSEEEESDGGGPPSIGGIPRPRRQGPRRRPWIWYPRRARKHPPPGHRWRHQQAPQRRQRVRRRYPPALEEEEAGFLQLEVSNISPCTPLISRDCHLPFCFLVDTVTLIVPALAPAKALRSGAPAMTRRRSARVPQIAASAAATGEPSRDTAAVTESQQEEAVAATVSQVLVPHASSQGRGQVHPESQPAGDHEAVGSAADDDAPPGCGQLREKPA
jgi:hypothetical protein